MDVYNDAVKLVEKSKNAVVASLDAQGWPNMKMMFNNRGREGIKTFYFSTNTSSLRVSQFLADSRSCLYFSDTRFYKGLMLRGDMEVLEDAGSKKSIWRTGDELYYPQGVGDPDYCVLRFTARSGRYYHGLKSADFTVE